MVAAVCPRSQRFMPTVENLENPEGALEYATVCVKHCPAAMVSSTPAPVHFHDPSKSTVHLVDFTNDMEEGKQIIKRGLGVSFIYTSPHSVMRNMKLSGGDSVVLVTHGKPNDNG